jgi:hypothetical protein
MHSDPAQLRERNSTDLAPVCVAPSPSAIVLDSSLQNAFSLVRITPGNWFTLFALPFLVAAKWLSARPNGWISNPWPRSSKQDWDNLFKKLEQWSREIAQICRREAMICRENEVIILHDALYPNGQGKLDEEKYGTARSLLCWHLAKDYDASERHKILSSVSGGFGLLDRTDDARKYLKGITDTFSPLIDKILPVPKFANSEELKSTPPETPKIPNAPFDDLGCLLIFPLAELLSGACLQGSDINEIVRKLLIPSLLGSELREFLEPPWAK